MGDKNRDRKEMEILEYSIHRWVYGVGLALVITSLQLVREVGGYSRDVLRTESEGYLSGFQRGRAERIMALMAST